MNTQGEQLIRLSRARIPGNPHISTRWRWCTRGISGTKLESIVVGGQRFTSAEAVERFLAKLNDPGVVELSATSAAEAAARELAEMR